MVCDIDWVMITFGTLKSASRLASKESHAAATPTPSTTPPKRCAGPESPRPSPILVSP